MPIHKSYLCALDQHQYPYQIHLISYHLIYHFEYFMD